MHAAARTMSRRYTYQPRMSARELSDAMHALRLSTGNVARLTGVGLRTINRALKGEEDTPVHLQATLYVWQRDPDALRLAIQWADEHAHDVRDDDDEPSRGNR